MGTSLHIQETGNKVSLGGKMAEVPKYVMQAFESWVEGWGWETERAFFPYKEIVIDVGPDNEDWPLTKLLGKLWRCSDHLPKDMCERLDLPEGSSYARAAQAIMARGRTRGKYIIPREGYRVPPS
ncbi:MAG TPA: hypothetical protein VNA87_05150 [Actinomycetota bacterium]|nr:hypothetical protein [Actinomycetota bacterium]